jgi:hypothetical protein
LLRDRPVQEANRQSIGISRHLIDLQGQSDLRLAHDRLASILGPAAEPVAVLERAEAHRSFWRPDRPRVVLLAESHVYTTIRELSRSLRPLIELPRGIPRGFVRLVYSLGYGEDSLLDEPVLSPRNSGTPQYWRIFQSCIGDPGTVIDYGTVQASRNPNSLARLRAKVTVLERLRARGVWLVDASVAALYLPGQAKPPARVRAAVLQTSWDAYTGGVVARAEPEAIICIGVGVVRALGSRLDTIGVPWAGVHQPQAHLTSPEHDRIHALYSAVCERPSKVRLIPSVV